MHAKDEQPGRKAPAGPLPARAATPAAAPGARPATPEAVMALQRSVGNRVVARLAGQDQHVHGAGCGHEGGAGPGGSEQRALLDAAVTSPGRPLSGSLRADAESFYQNDPSATRLHDSPVAQRATAAMGAQAMTIGTHVFLGEIVHEVAPDRSPDSIQSAIHRLVKGRTGHESRDNRTPGDPVVRRPDKGRYDTGDRYVRDPRAGRMTSIDEDVQMRGRAGARPGPARPPERAVRPCPRGQPGLPP
ncbi:eCIS core domain-containing protein [Streptomyces koyangensis]|uniref:eCIS core domain-containing protein n=1 Tax=Streptomyces koyangensis TaxID=188770 RepID=UPI003C2D339C